MALRELQQDLQRYLLAEPSTIMDAIVDAPPLAVADRLGIYGNAYRVRLIDALHETYPVLHALLGDDMFFELGGAYVAANPPNSAIFAGMGSRWRISWPIARHLMNNPFFPKLHCWSGRSRKSSMPRMRRRCRAPHWPPLRLKTGMN